MTIRKYLGPHRLFLWHCVQAITCIILIITGFGMYFAELGEYLMPFEMRHNLHKLAGIVSGISFLLLFIPYHLEANRHRVHYWWRLALYRLGAYDNLHQQSKQQFKPIIITRYIVIMFLVFPLVLCSGAFLIFPEMLMHSSTGFDLYYMVLFLHIACASIIVLFTFIHLYVALVDKQKATRLNGLFKIWFKS